MCMKISADELSAFQASLIGLDTQEQSSAVDAFALKLVEAQDVAGSTGDGDGRTPLDIAKAIARSVLPVSDDVYDARLRACSLCEHARHLRTGRAAVIQCGLCKCLMNVKARLRGGACPEGRFR